MRRMATMLTLLAATALGGCGGSDEPAGGGGGGGVATTGAPGPTAAPATSEPAVLEAGRHPVYLKTVDPDRRTVTFDLIQFFTDAAAAPITANTLTAQSSGRATRNVPLTLEELAGYFPAADADPFWITVDGGQVTRIAQQYLP